jgi:hypothetical protein
MLLVDTSVWIDHLRYGTIGLTDLLSEGLVLMHPCVSGELACGNLKNRTAIIADLNAIPAATRATDAEVFHLIEDKRLWGRGLGWIDAHLLASALLSKCSFWTLDKRLERVARDLRLN